MRLVDPTADREPLHNTRAPRLDRLAGTTIGLLSNGKTNADVLLRETAALFKEEYDCQVLPVVQKPNFGAPAPRELVDELAEQCDMLLTASGD